MAVFPCLSFRCLWKTVTWPSSILCSLGKAITLRIFISNWSLPAENLVWTQIHQLEFWGNKTLLFFFILPPPPFFCPFLRFFSSLLSPSGIAETPSANETSKCNLWLARYYSKKFTHTTEARRKDLLHERKEPGDALAASKNRWMLGSYWRKRDERCEPKTTKNKIEE